MSTSNQWGGKQTSSNPLLKAYKLSERCVQLDTWRLHLDNKAEAKVKAELVVEAEEAEEREREEAAPNLGLIH